MSHTETLARITVDPDPRVEDVLTGPVQAFLIALHEQFGSARNDLLDRHAAQRTKPDSTAEWDPETAHIRSNEWHIAPAPPDLIDRRTELTGPVSRTALVEGLNSGAQVYMADFEDTITPTWATCLDGQRNLRDAYNGTLTAAFDGELRAPAGETATLMVRTRGWHLDETHVTSTALPCRPASSISVCVSSTTPPLRSSTAPLRTSTCPSSKVRLMRRSGTT